MNHAEKIVWMTDWCKRNGAVLQLSGECGFGRECVGVSVGGTFPDYEWYDNETYERIDSNGDVWTPENAYHKHPCVAVLGRDESAESELYDWLKWFDENGFQVECGDSPKSEWAHLGMIAIALGKHRYCRLVKQINGR